MTYHNNFIKNKNYKLSAKTPTEHALQEISKAKSARQYGMFSNYEEDEKNHDLDSIKKAINHRSAAIKYEIYEIGRLLCEAKKLLKHGEFKPWIKENCNFSFSTAINFKRVFQTCLGTPELVEHYNASCLYEICSPKFPETLREHLFENTEGFIDASKKEIIEIGMKYRDGKIQLNSPEVQELLIGQIQKNEFEKCTIEILNSIKFLKDRLLKIEQIKNHQELNNPILDKKAEEINDIIKSPKKRCIKIMEEALAPLKKFISHGYKEFEKPIKITNS